MEREGITDIAKKQLIEVDKILEKEYNLKSVVNENKRKKRVIDDYGEVIYGARKDFFKEISQEYSVITKQSLIELPLAKSIKIPPFERMVKEGAIDNDEATFFFAIFCTIRKKPTGSSWSQRRKIESWAEETFKKVLLIKSIMVEDKDARDSIIEKAKIVSEDEQQRFDKRIEWLKRHNPQYAEDYYSKPVANSYSVIFNVLKKYGYKAGQKIDVPFSGVLTNESRKGGYSAIGNDGSKILWSEYSIGELEDSMCLLLSLANMDENMQIPINLFKFVGFKREYKTLDTYKGLLVDKHFKYLSDWYRNVSLEFLEEKKKEFKSKHPNKIVEIWSEREKEFVGYVSYKITLNLFGKTYEKEVDTRSLDETRSYLEENYDELNEYFVSQIISSKVKKRKSELERKFVIGKTWHKEDKSYHYDVWYIVKEPFSHCVATFDNEIKAKEFLNKNGLAILERIKQNEEKLGKNFKTVGREGRDWRHGEDVNEKAFCDEFGFRGIQFGNWTNLNDRQEALNECYDAFCDMAYLLGWENKSMSINGELGIAFGARGTGWANAHYEGGQVVINLTKTRGAGTLAHEWWHALDNYFERKNGQPGLLLTDVVLSRYSATNIRKEVFDCYSKIVQAVKDSNYFKRSQEKGVSYWGSNCEMTARMFQVYIDNKLSKIGLRSPFLERGGYAEMEDERMKLSYYVKKKFDENFNLSFDEYKKTVNPFRFASYVYPTQEEIKTFSPLIEELFKTIKREKVEDRISLSGFSNNTTEITEETKIEDVQLSIANINSYKEGQFYINIDLDPKNIAKTLCHMFMMRLGNIGKYNINGISLTASIVDIDIDKNISEFEVSIDYPNGREVFSYRFNRYGNKKAVVVDAIINGMKNFFSNGEYSENSGLYIKK